MGEIFEKSTRAINLQQSGKVEGSALGIFVPWVEIGRSLFGQIFIF